MQCFDVDSKGELYYVQIAGSDAHKLHVLRGGANQSPADFMTLRWFGHGTNMAVEEQGADRYIWINSNANKLDDNSYSQSQTVSRIKYEAGKTLDKYSGETFYLPGKRNVHPAIDAASDLLAITASTTGVRDFYVYKLSEALALPVSDVSLTVTWGGEEGTQKNDGNARRRSATGPAHPRRPILRQHRENGRRPGILRFPGIRLHERHHLFLRGYRQQQRRQNGLGRLCHAARPEGCAGLSPHEGRGHSRHAGAHNSRHHIHGLYGGRGHQDEERLAVAGLRLEVDRRHPPRQHIPLLNKIGFWFDRLHAMRAACFSGQAKEAPERQGVPEPLQVSTVPIRDRRPDRSAEIRACA